MGANTSGIAIAVKRLSKRFPGIQALDQVDFTLIEGEVHGLVGGNGAGKSTLIKAIAGAHVPDEGEIAIFGQPLVHHGAAYARRAGVSVIHQELTIIPAMSAMDNIFLGRMPSRAFFVRSGEMRQTFTRLAKRFRLDVDPDAAGGSLSIANQQMLEIIRALLAEHRILIMDEPTASLGPAERSRLFEVIAELRRERTSIIYVSHDLDEVLSICDRVSVMRDGRLVATAPKSAWTKSSIVQTMVGEIRQPAANRAPPPASAPLVLDVKSLSLPGLLADISFSLRRGETLGVAGLVGAGRTELLRCLAGLESDATGEVAVEGRPYALAKGVRTGLRAGIALAPEDRKRQGLIASLTAANNVVITNMQPVTRMSFLQPAAERRQAAKIAATLGFAASRLGALAGTLSGGNQQKIVIGKWLHYGPKILLLDEPTRGIDIAAKAEIFATMRTLAERGAGIILVSSELEEVVEQSDRVIVLARGRVIATLRRDEATVDRILGLIFSVEGKAA
jgi:ABC-type sugar transport system ATPase subunit